jgi:hypothetical protein
MYTVLGFNGFWRTTKKMNFFSDKEDELFHGFPVFTDFRFSRISGFHGFPVFTDFRLAGYSL